MMNTLNNQMLSFQKNLIKIQNTVQYFSFYSCLCQKLIQQIGIGYGLLSHIIKIKRIIIAEAENSSKKREKKNSI